MEITKIHAVLRYEEDLKSISKKFERADLRGSVCRQPADPQNAMEIQFGAGLAQKPKMGISAETVIGFASVQGLRLKMCKKNCQASAGLTKCCYIKVK